MYKLLANLQSSRYFNKRAFAIMPSDTQSLTSNNILALVLATTSDSCAGTSFKVIPVNDSTDVHKRNNAGIGVSTATCIGNGILQVFFGVGATPCKARAGLVQVKALDEQQVFQAALTVNVVIKYMVGFNYLTVCCGVGYSPECTAKIAAYVCRR